METPEKINRARHDLARLLETSALTLRSVASQTGIDPGQLSRFQKGEVGMSEERLSKLESFIAKLLATSEHIIQPDAIKELAQALFENRLTLFVGAGLSRQAMPPGGKKPLPLWGELASSLVSDLLGEGTSEEMSDLEPLEKLDYLQEEKKGGDVKRLLRDTYLDAYDYKPSKAHLTLAHLPWKCVITTNYDNLLSHPDMISVIEERDKRETDATRKRRDAWRFPVVTDGDFGTRNPRQIRLIHLNGDLREPHTLFSEDFHAWEERHPRAISYLQDAVSPPNRVLFVGYSFSDPFLTELLTRVRLMSERDGVENRIHAWMWRMTEVKRKISEKRFRSWIQIIQHDHEWERAFVELERAYEQVLQEYGRGRKSSFLTPQANEQLRALFSPQQKKTYERANLAGLYIGEAYRPGDVLQEHVFVRPSLCRFTDQRLPHNEGALYDCRDAYDWLDGKVPMDTKGRPGMEEHVRTAEIDPTKGRALIILGEPGGGKSSLLQTYMMERISDWAKAPADHPFPLYLRLSLWEQEKLRPGNGKMTLPDYALMVIAEALDIPESDRESLLPWLTQGQVYWLLDGVDEVRSDKPRHALIEELNQLRAQWPSHHFAITTRPSGYFDRPPEDRLASKDWPHVKLAELEPDQAKALLNKWAVLLTRLHATAKPFYDPEELYEELGSQSGISRLRHNPLLLTMIVQFYRDNFRLPRNRWEFYYHATQNLRMNWVRHRAGDPEQAGYIVDRSYYDALLPELAIHAARTKSTLQDSAQLKSILAQVLAPRVKEGLDLEQEIKTFFHDAIALIGVYVEKGLNQFGFLHLTFQEYFAAQWLLSHHKEAVMLIQAHWNSSHWKEIWKLYALGLGTDEQRLDELHSLAGTSADAMAERLEWLGLGSPPIPAPDASDSARAETHSWAIAQLNSNSTLVPKALAALSAWERRYPDPLRSALLQRLGDPDNEQAHATARALGEQSDGREMRNELMRALCEAKNERTRGFAELALGQKIENQLVQKALLSLYHGVPPENSTHLVPLEARLGTARALGGRVPALPLQESSSPTKTLPLAPDVHMTFVRIPSGTLLGGENGKIRAQIGEFWLAQTQVTQAQWQAVMGDDPSHFKGTHLPVEKVSWDLIAEGEDCFNSRLTRLLSGPFTPDHRAHLPSEAQWEYACRAETDTPYHMGKTLASHQANFNGNNPDGAEKGVYRQRTVVVGSFPPNKWGLYDMHGNVWEWCDDYWADKPAEDYAPPKTGSNRVIRGGGWDYLAVLCRSAIRDGYGPEFRSDDLGFRPAVSIRQG